MAVYRQTPKCTFCGEPTHKALNRDMSNVPISERVYGDNFIGWFDLNHICKGLEDFRKEANNIWNKHKDEEKS